MCDDSVIGPSEADRSRAPGSQEGNSCRSRAARASLVLAGRRALADDDEAGVWPTRRAIRGWRTCRRGGERARRPAAAPGEGCATSSIEPCCSRSPVKSMWRPAKATSSTRLRALSEVSGCQPAGGCRTVNRTPADSQDSGAVDRLDRDAAGPDLLDEHGSPRDWSRRRNPGGTRTTPIGNRSSRSGRPS